MFEHSSTTHISPIPHALRAVLSFDTHFSPISWGLSIPEMISRISAFTAAIAQLSLAFGARGGRSGLSDSGDKNLFVSEWWPEPVGQLPGERLACEIFHPRKVPRHYKAVGGRGGGGAIKLPQRHKQGGASKCWFWCFEAFLVHWFSHPLKSLLEVPKTECRWEWAHPCLDLHTCLWAQRGTSANPDLTAEHPSSTHTDPDWEEVSGLVEKLCDSGTPGRRLYSTKRPVAAVMDFTSIFRGR